MASSSSILGTERHSIVPNELSTALAQATPDSVKTISATLARAGVRSWLVGGSVRDVALALLRGETPSLSGDFDLASDARPEQVQKLIKKVLPTGIQHGTVTVVLDRQHFELTTHRDELFVVEKRA